MRSTALWLFSLALTAAAAHAGHVELLSRVDPGAGGPPRAPGYADGPAITPDGRYVAFESTAPNLIPGQVEGNTGQDIFLWDRTAGTVTLVSHSSANAARTGSGTSSSPRISRDGRWIAYSSSSSDLVSGVNDSNGKEDTFLFDRAGGANLLVSRTAASASTTGNGRSFLPWMSGDGRFVAFDSLATDLVNGTDTNLNDDAFLFDRADGSVTLLSHREGAPAEAANGGTAAFGVSDDGGIIALQSLATNLLTAVTDNNQAQDFYLVDRLTGTVELASRSLASPALTGNAPTSIGGVVASLSADGHAMMFNSYASDMVAGDTNEAADFFVYVLSPGLGYHTLTPCRLFDSRRPQDGPSLLSGVTVTLLVPDICAIPATARGLALNVTVLGATGGGHVTLSPGGTTPLTSTLNFSAGATRANNAILSLGLGGTLAVTPSVTGNGTVHVILDVSGYFE